MKHNMLRLPLVVLMALMLVIATAGTVFAAAPAIQKTDYDGKGKVEVDFSGDVSYKKVKVKVTEPSGKTYRAKILAKDDDDLTFKLKNYKAGKTYKFKITGIKERGTSKYGSVKDSVKIPAKAKITKSKAISIAVKHAKKKLHAEKVRNKQAEKDTYKKKATWEVDFEAQINGKWYEFDYDVSRSTGKILRYKYELD